MTVFADLLSTLFERRLRRPGAGENDGRPMAALCADLVGARGEVTGLATADAILARYAGLDDEGKRAFFRHLAAEMDIAPEAVRAALADYEADPGRASYRAFMSAAEPPRQELVRRLNQVPGATGALVGLRADLLRLGRGEPALEALDLDLRHLFASWFNRGFLVLRPVSWESPAHILEKIIAYEAVHAIDSWDALRRRLAPPDRRCFAFFHPAMPDEPLIFVEVALTTGIPGSVQALLSPDRPALVPGAADTAVFYSISNCQAGLAGISFGNSLIKQVVSDLSVALPQLATFVTLSPIPGLMRWLAAQGLATPPDRMRALAARYLLHAKDARGRPLDPVARFHLGNGARIHALHDRADLSDRGQRQSGGVMVNYLYDMASLGENHEGFATSGAIAAAPAIRTLADTADPLSA